MRWFASKADALLKGEKVNPLTRNIRALVERRLARMMQLEPEEFVRLTSTAPLGELINALYVFAEPHDLGGFNCVFNFLSRVIGRDEVWRVPEVEPEKSESMQEPEIVH